MKNMYEKTYEKNDIYFRLGIPYNIASTQKFLTYFQGGQFLQA